METLTALRTMLAVREYQAKPIADAVAREILEAGRLTGSARNRQPWRFVVIRRPDSLARLGELCSRGPYVGTAGLAVAVYIDGSAPATVDGARAIQSMMAAAWSLGVGSNWISVIPEELPALNEIVGAPTEWRLLALIAFGYPAKPGGRGKKDRKPLAEIAFGERWGTPL